MADVTLRSPDRFPPGTTVGAYLATQANEGQAPSGAALTTAVVAASGALTFSGLAAGTRHVAYAQVGGVHTYLRFGTDPFTPTGFDTDRQASAVATMSDLLAQASLALTTGDVRGAVAFALAAGTFSRIRLLTGSTAPAALTDVRAAVWDENGNLLQATANIAAAITAANALIDQPLAAPVTLSKGQQVLLGVAWVGTTLQVRGVGSTGALMAARGLRPFILARAGAGYAGGAVPALGAAAGGIVPWLELAT